MIALALLLTAAAGWSPPPLERIFLHTINPPFHGVRRGWLRMALALHGAALLAAAWLPLVDLAQRARDRIERARPSAIAAALFALAAGLRLAFIEADSPAGALSSSGAFGTDEGAYSFLASEWAAGRDPLGGPEYLAGAVSLPLTALDTILFRAFGVSIVTVRVSGALLGALMAPMIYLLGRRVLGAGIALAAGLLAAVNFFLVMYQRTGMPDGELAAAGLLAWLLFERAMLEERPSRSALAAGVLAGIAVWIKPSALVLLVGAGAAVVDARRRGARSASLWISAGAFAAGVLLVGAAAAIVFAIEPRLMDAYRAVLTHNAQQPPEGLLKWKDRLVDVLRTTQGLTHAPLFTAAGLAGIVWALWAFARKTAPPGAVFLGAWAGAAVLMLARHGYFPPRYFQQTAMPLVILGLLAARALADALGRAPARAWAASLAASAAVALAGADFAYSAARYGQWAAGRAYSQRDVGLRVREIAAREGIARPVVAGAWSLNLSLSGGFTPLGYRSPYIKAKDAVREGADYILFLGPAPLDQQRESPYPLELLTRFRYHDNYYLDHHDLYLYAVRRR